MLLDKLTSLSAQNALTAGGGRQNFIAQNNKRTRLFKVRLSATLTVTVAGTLVRNNGSLLGVISQLGISQGSMDQVVADGRILQAYAQYFAGGLLPGTRLTVAQAGAPAAYPLVEEVYIQCAFPYSAKPTETYFMEDNPLNQFFAFVAQNSLGAAAITDATATLGAITATVTQVYDENIANKPLFVPYIDTTELAVSGAITNGRVDLRASDYIAAVVVQQDTANRGAVADIINSLTYLGDGVNIVGPNQVAWNDLVDGMASESGGAAAYLAAGFTRSWWAYNHIKSGTLSALLPPNQIPNLRMEFNAQPSVVAGATGSVIRVMRVMYRRDLIVCAPSVPFPVTG